MTRAALARDVIGFSAAAAAALMLVLTPGTEPARAVAFAALAALAAWIAWQDASDFTIPDGAAAGLALLALADRFVRGAGAGDAALDTALRCAVDVAIVGGGLWAVREAFWRRRGYDGLGFGDVKLGAASALLIGAAGFSVALLGASALGIAILLAARGRSEDVGSARLAFGAVLAPAVVLVRLAQELPAAAVYVGGPP